MICNVEVGGLKQAEMLYTTNYVAIVGGGSYARLKRNCVAVWDESRRATIFELQFKEEVTAVKIRRDRIVIATIHRIFIYTFGPTPQLLHSFETSENSNGLLAVSVSPNNPATITFPGRNKGQVQILELPPTPQDDSPVDASLPVTPSMTLIPAHSSHLSYLALSPTGSLLASASDKGTLIRVFCTKTKRLRHELRRGADQALIYNIAFNHEGTRVCAASDKGTIHVFNLADDSSTGHTNNDGEVSPTISSTHSSQHAGPPPSPPRTPSSPHNTSKNRQSILSSFSPYLPKYFSSQWSFAHFRLPTEARSTCAFAPPDIKSAPTHSAASQFTYNIPNIGTFPSSRTDAGRESVIALCADGSMYRFSYDLKKGGECVREAYHRFFKGLQCIDGDDDGQGLVGNVGWEDIE
ncbi:WD40-repeat-containing domain protein [Phlyctochytrium arcticum]|nr:WD40-repeat-containing domain protein [Phlyctochytrium arcticum]